MDHIISNHPIIENNFSWDEFSEVGDDLKDITLTIDDSRILKWINNAKIKNLP